MDDYQGRPVRWCPGCGDHGALNAVKRLCYEKQLPPERTVVVSGIGCSSRFPHYMSTYGFHGLHGRAFPVACGVKSRRPDLNVFVVTGDGDCCAIGAGHWIHALRYNMDLTVILLDNNIYGLTKNQTSPTTRVGEHTNTHPRGTIIPPLNPLTVALGITNASFVAQTVDWNPAHVYSTITAAHEHRGLSFVRILQRCPHFMPNIFTSLMSDPKNVVLLRHERGMQVSDALAKLYPTHENHDPSNLNRAREIAENEERVPVGILYRNDSITRYEDTRRPKRAPSWDQNKAVLEGAFDKLGIFPRAGA